MNGKPACRIYLIRHGETVNASEVCFNGHHDVALSEQGMEQSRRLAGALKDLPVKAVYCSDLKRTRLGAQFISDPHGLSPFPCPELRELCFGAWEGLSVDAVNRKFPGQLARRLKNIETFCVEGGETFPQLRDRVIPRFEEIVSMHPDDCIVILCHGGVIRTLLAHVLGIPVKNLFRVHQPYAAVNILQYYKGGEAVVELAGGSFENIHPFDSPDPKMTLQ